MHIIKRNDCYVLYNERTLEFYNVNKELGEKLIALSDSEIDELINSSSREEKLASPFNTDFERCERIVMVVSQDCNLACKYCYAQQGTYGEECQKIMNMETFQNAIKYTLKKYPKGIEKIQFFGGEPLININLIEEGCAWIKKYFKQQKLPMPIFTIVTNGTLINDRIIKLFNKYKFLVTISLDGNKYTNDINRIFKYGDNSVFDCVSENIKLLNKKRKFFLAIEITADKGNIQQFIDNKEKLLDIEAIHELRPETIHIVPAIWSDSCERYDNGYMEDLKRYFDKVTKYSIDTMTTSNKMAIMKVADMVQCLIKRSRKKYLCGAGLTELSVDVKGDVYPCFAFIGSEEMLMGNVNDEALDYKYDEVIKVFERNTYDNLESCKDCWAKGMCSNCIGNAFLVNGSISKPLPELCEVQKVQLERTLVECNRIIKSGEKFGRKLSKSF